MIDTHQHLLYPEHFGYAWTKELPALDKAFHLADYREAAKDTPISGTLFMEVDVDEGQAGKEAAFFCKLAEDESSGILGVIASARPEVQGFDAQVEALLHPKLKGVRRVLHTQPDELSESALFREQLGCLANYGLTFDLCVRQDQLDKAIALARACPNVTFILDHCGVPGIAGNDATTGEGWQHWQKSIRKLAELPNVNGKLSGITVYASEAQRTEQGLKPYIEVMLEAFGGKRLVWGGDWPVVLLGSGLKRWCELSQSLLQKLSQEEQSAIFSANAHHIYKL